MRSGRTCSRAPARSTTRGSGRCSGSTRGWRWTSCAGRPSRADGTRDAGAILVGRAVAKVDEEIETFAGEVESYTDQKLLIYATRPEKK